MQPDQAFENELATVLDHGVTEGKAAPQVYVQFKLDNVQGNNGEDLTITAYMSLSEAALKYSLEKLAAIGWHGTNIEELDRNNSNAVDLTGHKALISTAFEEYNGKNRLKVTFINDPDRPPVNKALEPAKLSEASARLRGKIAAFRAKNPAPQPKKEEEIPF